MGIKCFCRSVDRWARGTSFNTAISGWKPGDYICFLVILIPASSYPSFYFRAIHTVILTVFLSSIFIAYLRYLREIRRTSTGSSYFATAQAG